MSPHAPVIIGSGPAGLATAVCLQRRGITATVLERADTPSFALRSVDPDMRLVSPRRLSTLPFMPRLPGNDDYLSFADYVDTLDRYRRTHGIEVVTGAAVDSVGRSGNALVVGTADGRDFLASSVVNAAGCISTPHLPSDIDALAVPWMHSREVRREHLAKSHSLVVVGGGTSAAGVLSLYSQVRPAGARAWVSVRDGVRSVPQKIMGVDVHYLAWLAEKVPTSRLPWLRRWPEPGLSLRRAIERADAEVIGPVTSYHEQRLQGAGFSIDPDLVVFATGYRYGCDHLRGVVDIDGDGYPITRGCVSRRDQDVYLLGLRLSRNFASSFLRGIASDAAVVAKRIARRGRA